MAYPHPVYERILPTGARSYSVRGMTCEHCVMSVREEIAEVRGVEHVDVDLADGRVVVVGSGLDDHAVIAAVAEAGYEAVAA